MLHPKENNVLYCVQDVVFVFAKLQDGALRSGFSCNFAAIHLLSSPRLTITFHLPFSIFNFPFTKSLNFSRRLP